MPEVVVKNGGREVCWAVGGKTGAETDMAVVQPVDSTGAGDSFNGAYLAARLQGGDVAFAIRAGHAVAVKVIGHRGALLPQAALSRPDSRS